MKKKIVWLAIPIMIFVLFLSSNMRLPTINASLEHENIPVLEAEDDLVIDFTLNQSTIGKNNGILGELTLTNNGINPVSNIKANFSLSNDNVKFTSSYSTEQTVSLINPSSSTDLYIETELNQTTIEEGTSAADVVLLFDASGSMSEEIGSVKEEFLTITNNLQDQIASLRMGMIVYGWNKYSEYPASSVNNYIELTDEISSVHSFINELYASGGVEPWGDAFSVINTWDWREEVPKLAIIVGDEDCDPGNLVGTGVSDSYYNGSQLLDVITSLKEKKVKINSVITGESGIVVNQFTWIAEYTGGECVFLSELQSGENPVSLPEQIEQWTLELTREYFVDIIVDISWTELEPGNNQDYQITTKETLIVDISGPSITVSTITNEISPGQFDLELTIKPRDVSNISQVNIYWTFDDLNSELEPTWYFKILTNKIDDYYLETISDLEEGSLVSFYIEATDSVYNTGYSVIYNITIAVTPICFGQVTEFFLPEENSNRSLLFNFTKQSYYTTPTSDSGCLWIEADQTLDITLPDQSSISSDLLVNLDNYTIYTITKLLSVDNFRIIISGDKSSSVIKVRWEYTLEYAINSGYSGREWYIDEFNRMTLFDMTLTSVSETNYLSLIVYGGAPLIAAVHIFDENWNKVAKIGTFDPYELATGHYYLWVEQVVRDGSFSLYYGPEQITTNDDYYTAAYGFSIWITILSLLSTTIIFQRWIKKKKRKL